VLNLYLAATAAAVEPAPAAAAAAALTEQHCGLGGGVVRISIQDLRKFYMSNLRLVLILCSVEQQQQQQQQH
jgi:hypothetical protein